MHFQSTLIIFFLYLYCVQIFSNWIHVVLVFIVVSTLINERDYLTLGNYIDSSCHWETIEK